LSYTRKGPDEPLTPQRYYASASPWDPRAPRSGPWAAASLERLPSVSVRRCTTGSEESSSSSISWAASTWASARPRAAAPLPRGPERVEGPPRPLPQPVLGEGPPRTTRSGATRACACATRRSSSGRSSATRGCATWPTPCGVRASTPATKRSCSPYFEMAADSLMNSR